MKTKKIPLYCKLLYVAQCLISCYRFCVPIKSVSLRSDISAQLFKQVTPLSLVPLFGLWDSIGPENFVVKIKHLKAKVEWYLSIDTPDDLPLDDLAIKYEQSQVIRVINTKTAGVMVVLPEAADSIEGNN